MTVRAKVREFLESSPAFRALEPAKCRKMADDMIKVAEFLADSPEAAKQFDAALKAADFPKFVGNLIQGVFQAIVNSSIQQMEAYADLLKSVADAVDDFAKDPKDNTNENAKQEARSRQQLLATMVLMGINRIVVTNGEIKAK